MPSASPSVSPKQAQALRALGRRLRELRKRLGVSAVTAAEAAGMSRVTLYRIEKGEPSVAMGAWFSAAAALGLELDLREPQRPGARSPRPRPVLPKAIRLAEYPQLARLAWQLRGKTEITPQEALDLYERNWRHVESSELEAPERELLQTLLDAFGRDRLLV